MGAGGGAPRTTSEEKVALQRSRVAPGHQPEPPALVRSIVAGAVATLLLAVALGTAVAFNGPPDAWLSQVSLIVRPTPDQSDAAKAGYYENLSNGQVVQTYAEVLRSRNLGGVDSDGQPLAEVLVVPDTFLLRIVLESETRELAVSRAEQAGAEAVAVIDALEQPYALNVVGGAADNVQETGGIDPALLGVVAVGALLFGAGVQQLVWFLQRRRYEGRAAVADPVHAGARRRASASAPRQQPAVR